MSIWELDDDAIRPLEKTAFAAEGVLEREHLQRLLAGNITAIDPDLLVIAEEYSDWAESRRRIDILALDQAANLVVVELKRSESGGHMDLQAIRYAAMVSTMTFARAVDTYQHYLHKQGLEAHAESKVLEFLDWDEPNEDDFANDVSIILVSAEFSREITSAVLWLNTHDIDIRCLRLRPYRLEDRLLLDIQQIVPLKEAQDYQIQQKEKAAEQRGARRGSGLDFTRFDLTIGDRTYTNLPKRWLIYHAVRAAVEAGNDPEEVVAGMPLPKRRWVSVDGECNEEKFLELLGEQRTVRGKPYDTRRYFTRDEELIHFKGRTYALSNQWGGKRDMEAVRDLAEKYADRRISYEPAIRD